MIRERINPKRAIDQPPTPTPNISMATPMPLRTSAMVEIEAEIEIERVHDVEDEIARSDSSRSSPE